MDRRSFVTKAVAIGAASIVSPMYRLAAEPKSSDGKGLIVSTTKLTPPVAGGIAVAVPISEGATVIDFAGPWDVFVSVMLPGGDGSMSDQMPFHLFTVSTTKQPVTVEGGMKIVPDYTFADAPLYRVAVVPAQRGSEQLHAWLRKTAASADVVMSVCTGVMQVARAGLLKGKSATTHHDYYDRLTREHPDIDLKRGVRFVENEKISTAGGETCGIDLALRVVERYFGRLVAARTAVFIEHQGTSWMV
jgi:transcriptional regulator GlxA family with amidase domain